MEESSVKNFFINLAQTLLAAAIIGNVVLLLKLNERVSRIEYRLGIVATASTSTPE